MDYQWVKPMGSGQLSRSLFLLFFSSSLLSASAHQMCKSTLFCRLRCILSILQAPLMTLQAVNAWKKESGSVYGFPRCAVPQGLDRPIWFQQTSSQMFLSFVFCLYRVILTLFLARVLTYSVNPGPHCSLLWSCWWQSQTLTWLQSALTLFN